MKRLAYLASPPIGSAMAGSTASLAGGVAAAPDGSYDADVVILALDRAEETVAAIASALAQTGVSRHVFVVDQGSRPETLARLAGAMAGASDATLVALDGNLGVAGGRNRGTALGHGRVIVGLDNDAEFADDDHAGARRRRAGRGPGVGGDRLPDRGRTRPARTICRPGAIRAACCHAPATSFDAVDVRRRRPRDPARGLGRVRRLRRRAVLLLGGVRLLPARDRPRLAHPLSRRHRRSATRSARSSASRGPARAGSISCATDCISAASGALRGSPSRRASRVIC